MALQDIFKFRDLPESETSKPFLEHLEDLRWTIVKVAITLVAAMIICFAFRSTLVRVMQAPLHEIDPQVGALRALGITDSLVISFHLAFYAGIVLSFPLLLYFLAEFVLPALTALEKRFLFPAIGVSFVLFLFGVFVCYFWLLPKTILFFFRDTQSLGWAPTWTVQQYYSFAVVLRRPVLRLRRLAFPSVPEFPSHDREFLLASRLGGRPGFRSFCLHRRGRFCAGK